MSVILAEIAMCMSEQSRARGGERAMTKQELTAHLYGILVPIEVELDFQAIEAKVYSTWASECERLGFPEEAEIYRAKVQEQASTRSQRWPGSD